MTISKYYELALVEARKKRGADLSKVLRLLRRAHKQRDARAAYALGTWYLHGQAPVVQKNLPRALTLLREAARADHADAIFDLAVCYEKGTGVRMSERKAAACYVRAALLGDEQAIYEVGRCYWHGLGLKRDRLIAGIWLDHAAKHNIRE